MSAKCLYNVEHHSYILLSQITCMIKTIVFGVCCIRGLLYPHYACQYDIFQIHVGCHILGMTELIYKCVHVFARQ